MSKKWYNYFVSVDQEGVSDQPPDERVPVSGSDRARPATSAPGSAAQTVADIAASIAKAPPKFTQPVPLTSGFDEIYKAAEIPQPANGFTIFKIADMLRSEHIRNLPIEVKRSSVLLALDAAGVKLQDIIQDAVQRDRALDTFEGVQQRAVEALMNEKAAENKKLQEELDRLTADYKSKMLANDEKVAKEQQRFSAWKIEKQQEEQRIADAVAPFVSENPISAGVNTGAAAAEQKSKR